MEKFARKGAAPKRLQKTLLGEGGVQGTDGAVHRHRKQMFMNLMSSERVEQLADLVYQQWLDRVGDWEASDRIVLFDEAHDVLCRAVCEWSGVPLEAEKVALRTHDLAAMIDGSGGVGPRHWRGRLGRSRSESWLQEVIAAVRSSQLEVSEEKAVGAIARHRDLHGNLLDTQIAAVDLLNVLRPTVAIAQYIVFSALALHDHPDYR